MRARHLRFAAVCFLTTCISSSGLVARAEEFQPIGRWKLVFALQSLDLIVFNVTAENEAFKAKVVDSFRGLGPKVEMKTFSSSDGKITLSFDSQAGEIRFQGTPVNEGDNAGRVMGTFRLRGNLLPAWLEKTEANELSPPQPSPIQTKLFAAMQAPGEIEKVKKLEELIHEKPGPAVHAAYQLLFQFADAAKLTEDQLRKHLERWLDDAKAFGPEWVSQCRLAALQALQGKKRYASLALELAEQARKELAADASADEQVTVYQMLASSARLTGKDDLAAEADAKLTELNAKLDEEYHVKVPPFKPVAYGGREKPDDDRVVLLELFTGAQCPPCVAADVAFDALLSTFKPTELVAIQYHLHIPGPDPLTNSDTVSRSEYYGLRGTPTAYFSGETTPAGGGSMEMSEGKYNEYRKLIFDRLAAKKSATIELKVERSGETLEISALAKTDGIAAGAKPKSDTKPANAKGKRDKEKGDDEDTNKDADSGPKFFLRLALTEASIRYVGGNRLRFHHHVVRDFPGGVQGKRLESGEGKVELTVDLDGVRRKLTEYLNDFTKQAAFPAPLPPLELKNLALVAFVQDDTTKHVLHAVEVPVPESN